EELVMEPLRRLGVDGVASLGPADAHDADRGALVWFDGHGVTVPAWTVSGSAQWVAGVMISSRASRSSIVGCQVPAATFAVTCSGVVAPAMTDATAGWAARPPMATSRTDTPRSAANASMRSTTASAPSS